MKYLVFLLFFIPVLVFSQALKFEDHFVDSTLRIDYLHVGDAQEEIVTIDRVYRYGTWAGSKKNLVENFNNGRYYLKIYDKGSKKLIFSKGFDSYFGEYKTTDDALQGIKRSYHESALIPFPKAKILFTLEKRDKKNELSSFFRFSIDPSSVDISEEPLGQGVKVFEVLKNGSPHVKVDLALLAEGYTADEEEKFKRDLKKFTDVFFSHEPYNAYRESFNVYGVFKPSDQSGCDEPRRRIFKNTALGTTFNSLGSERYLMTEDNKSLRDIAAHVPYDAICIMINHSRYGGGGIYNLYCTFPIDSEWHVYLIVHEFGHSFSGLADEYYSSSTAYNEFYPLGLEPTEPNITALLDPKELKWKAYVTPGIEIPTPWEKKEHDEMGEAYQKIRQEMNEKIERLCQGKTPQEEIEKWKGISDRTSLQHAQKVDEFYRKSKYAGAVGAFEGAGYVSKGLYRPMLDCIMFSKGAKPYCKVCKEAVIRTIQFYSE